jgi:hypothetical protein
VLAQSIDPIGESNSALCTVSMALHDNMPPA